MLAGAGCSKLRELYAGTIAGMGDLVQPVGEGAGRASVESARMQRATDPAVVAAHLRLLPAELRRGMAPASEAAAGAATGTGAGAEAEVDVRGDWAAELATARGWGSKGEVGYAGAIHGGLMRIVRRSSITQALVGVLSAGPTKTVKYSGAKLMKMWQG